GRTRSTGAERVRRSRRTSPRRRASRCARVRSCDPWRAASRPPWRRQRGPPRRAVGRGPPACRRWCGCRCRRARPCPRRSLRSRVWPPRVLGVNLVPMSSGPDARPPLDPSRLPERVQVVEELASTNSRVTELAREGAPAGTVLVTEWQTAGRGRLDRVWTVPPRTAITFSVLLRPGLAPADWPWLPLLAGYVVRTALSDRVPGIGLKWPNDVLVGEEGRKLCGILVERVETAGGPAAVVGI